MCHGNECRDREVGSCPRCGKDVPRSESRGRPRKYCSKECCDLWFASKEGRADKERRGPTPLSPCLQCQAPCRNRFCGDECRDAWVACPAYCLGCGERIIRNRYGAAATFCSTSCSAKYRWKSLRDSRREGGKSECAQCGVAFAVRAIGRPQKYCSAACRNARKQSQRKRPPVRQRKCERCGDSFRSRYRRQFCSGACRWPNRKGTTAICVSCGKEFIKRESDIKCCSPKCRQARQRAKRKIATCLCCQKPFHWRRMGRRSGKYCSRECAFEARRLRLPCTRFTRRRGTSIECQLSAWFHSWGNDTEECESLPLSGGHLRRCRQYGVPYESISEKTVFDAAGWKCQMCGCDLLRKQTIGDDGKIDPRSPEIDHIIPLSLGAGVSPGHVPSNVQASCRGCNSAKGNRLAPRPAIHTLP